MGAIMRKAGVVIAALGASGCFYMDPINEAPSAEIESYDPSLPARGDDLVVYAQIFDPDGDAPEVRWRAYACADGSADLDLDGELETELAGCDGRTFASGSTFEFHFRAPHTTDSGMPATRVHVELEVNDPYGAFAVPDQADDINLDNRVPTIAPFETTGRSFRGAHPVGTTARIFTVIDDPDDDLVDVGYRATLFAPDGATLEDAVLDLVEGAVDPTTGQLAWDLTADVAGQWRVVVEAYDRLGERGSSTATVLFADDHPPCLGISEPAFPPEGAAIVLDEPRTFRVLSVDDDLDVQPAPGPDDPVLGAASFRWFVGAPGALAAVPTTGNQVLVDPARYQPGTILELRVEAVDRVDRPLCDPALPSCEAVAACFQRRSWTLEVR